MLFATPCALWVIDFAELARIGGKKSIPALLEAARNSGIGVDCVPCQSALKVCLPHLRATDAALLAARDRRYLNGVLNGFGTDSECQQSHTAYILAIMKAYEQVGDASAIPIVARLATINPSNDCQRTIQQAAQERLPLLTARVSSLEPEQTLLRASAPGDSTPDTLLRAATPDTNAPKGELLRAADHKDGSSA